MDIHIQTHSQQGITILEFKVYELLSPWNQKKLFQIRYGHTRI